MLIRQKIMHSVKKPIKFFIVILLVCLFLSGITALSYADSRQTSRPINESSDKIAFNFVDVEIPSIIKFISEITGYNFIFDERIRGKTTIIAPTELSVEESFSLFTSVLSLKGYTVIPSGPNTYKIIPSSMAKQEGILPSDEKMPVNESYIIKLLMTEHIRADETLQFLRPIVSRDGHISAFGPRNLLLVVDSAMNIEKIIAILKVIDKPSLEEEPAKINVYFLEHANAIDLAQVLQGIIKGLQTSYQAAIRAKKDIPSSSAPILSITPDKATNSLIIVAPPSDYQSLAEVIKLLDKKRKQVFVEAMIVEASVDKLQELGTRWRAIARDDGDPIAIGGFGNINSGTILDIITGLTGFSAGGMGNFLDIPVQTIGADGTISTQTITAPGFAAIFSMEEFKNAVNVLSTPQILTSDNEEAEIFVGENSPFISQRERDIVTTSTVLNSIERTDVGIKLRITPQITEGDHVKLNIFQEISAVLEASDEVLTEVGPTTTKRSTKTSVVVKDGHTVVIGGLMEEREEEGISKTPLLGDIPIIGWLFKFKTVNRSKKNLLVFLSPHVVKESSDVAQITEEKQKRVIKDEQLYSEGELLIKFRDEVSQERVLEIISDKNASVIKHFKAINVYHIRIKIKHTIEESIKEFIAIPEVLYAEPNYKMKIQRDTSHAHKVIREQIDPDVTTNEFSDSTALNKTDPGTDESKKKTTPIFSSTVSDTIKYKEDLPSAKAPPVEEPPINKEHSVPSSYGAMYFVQVGAWHNVQYAEDTLKKLKSAYPESFIIRENNFHVLRIPGVMTEQEGESIMRDLEDNFDQIPILVRVQR